MSLIMTQLVHDLRPNLTNRLPVIVSLLLLPVFGQQDVLAAIAPAHGLKCEHGVAHQLWPGKWHATVCDPA